MKATIPKNLIERPRYRHNHANDFLEILLKDGTEFTKDEFTEDVMREINSGDDRVNFDVVPKHADLYLLTEVKLLLKTKEYKCHIICSA